MLFAACEYFYLKLIVLCFNISWFSGPDYWEFLVGFEISFHEITKSTYISEIHGNGSVISVEVPENRTTDIAGNKNLASNLLQVNHCKVFCFSVCKSSFSSITLKHKFISFHVIIVSVFLTSTYWGSVCRF